MQALVALDQLQTIPFAIDAVCCGSALQTCSRQGWQQAIRLFWQTRLNFLQPSLISTNVIVLRHRITNPGRKCCISCHGLRLLTSVQMPILLVPCWVRFLGFCPSKCCKKQRPTPILLNTASLRCQRKRQRVGLGVSISFRFSVQAVDCRHGAFEHTVDDLGAILPLEVCHSAACPLHQKMWYSYSKYCEFQRVFEGLASPRKNWNTHWHSCKQWKWNIKFNLMLSLSVRF